MLDAMKLTKVVGAVCGSLLFFLLSSWAAESIYSMNDASHGGGESQAYNIDTGATEIEAVAEDTGPSFDELFASADASAGKKVFAKCKACHKINGANGIGPYMNGVVGRGKASVAGFSYSETLVGMQSDVWSPENLSGFLASPKTYAPGSKMSFAGLPKPQDRANLIAWLQTID
ncbi:MAG: cytochrome c [Paracoccaceae bacterium]|jgi:cytochrome c